MTALTLWFADAEAFRGCDLNKGSRFIEPMCLSSGRPLTAASARIINAARNDVMFAHYNGGLDALENPYPCDCTAGQFYADVARATIEEDVTPYGRATP